MSKKIPTRRAAAVAVAAVAVFGLLSACSTDSSGAGPAEETDAKIAADVDQCITDVRENVYNKGPNGEDPVAASTLTLTPEEIEQIKGMGKTAAIAWHVFGSDYSTAQVAALENTFEEMGIKVLATTDGQFTVQKQTNDISTILALKPDFLVSLPVDAPAQADIYQQVVDAGIKIVFVINAPQELKQGEDYLTVVGTDDYGTGMASACEMVRAINGKGQIGMIYHAANYYATQQRFDAAKEVFAKYPDIEIVEEKGSPGPDFASQGAASANAMINQYPDLKGIWTPWDTHAEGVLATARELGKTPDNFAITTIDLGETVAVDMASGGMIKADAGGQPYNQGVAEAMAIGYSLLGKPLDPYYAWNGVPSTKENVLDAWTEIYNVDPPQSLIDAAEAGEAGQ